MFRYTVPIHRMEEVFEHITYLPDSASYICDGYLYKIDMLTGLLIYCKTIEPESQPQEERKSSMNLSTAVFLINDNARAVMVTYETGENAPKTMFKTFDKSIKVDDFVVVPTDTRHHLTVCKVVEVDVDVDFDSSCQVKWLVGRVDLADTTEIKLWEDKVIESIKSAEKLKKRNELKASMETLIKESGQSIALLPASVELATAEEPVKAE